MGFNNEEPLSYKEILQKVDMYLFKIKELEQKTKQIKETRDKIKKIQDEIFKSSILSRATVRLSQFVSEANFQKDNIRLNLNHYCHFGLKKLFKEIARRFKIAENEVCCLSPEDITEFLKSGEVSGGMKKIIKLRKRAYYFLIQDGKVRKAIGEEALNLINKFSKQEKLSAEEINGQVAYGGKVKGNVLIALKVEDIDERVVENKILVVPMTTPEFVPFLPKVKAIITDEGGITCHAAIVSREMRKPCIIGTKIATKVLKDGDLVEVDAEKGVVKLVKSK